MKWSHRISWRMIFWVLAIISIVGCATFKQSLSERWIPDCGSPSHDECCSNYLGEDYECTGTRINDEGDLEIQCGLRSGASR